MHQTKEQVKEILRRAEFLKEERTLKRRTAVCVLGSAACVGLLAFVCFFLPELSEGSGELASLHYGSALFRGPLAGLVLTALLSFALGILVTLLVLHIRKWKELERERKKGKW